MIFKDLLSKFPKDIKVCVFYSSNPHRPYFTQSVKDWLDESWNSIQLNMKVIDYKRFKDSINITLKENEL